MPKNQRTPKQTELLQQASLPALNYFLYASGLRPNEAAALCWRDIEFTNEGTTYYHGENGPKPTRITEEEYKRMAEAVEQGAVLDIAAVPKEIVRARILKSKNKVVREVPCDCVSLLRSWQALQAESSTTPLNAENLVFSIPDSRGNTSPFPHNSLNIYWRKMIDSLSTRLEGPEFSKKQYTPYSLGHSRAVYLINHNVGVYEAAKMLGHSVQTFEQHYAPYLSRTRGAELVASMSD